VQRPLWASTSTKNPQYSDLLYVEPLIGPDTVNTMPPATFEAFLDHGKVASTLEDGIEGAHKTMQSLQHLNIDLNRVTDILLSEGTAAFRDSYEKLLTNLDSKIRELSIPARR
jgi:transaldolase